MRDTWTDPSRLRQRQDQRPLSASGRYSTLVPVTRWPGFLIWWNLVVPAIQVTSTAPVVVTQH
jgi:hypothetical protein